MRPVFGTPLGQKPGCVGPLAVLDFAGPQGQGRNGPEAGGLGAPLTRRRGGKRQSRWPPPAPNGAVIAMERNQTVQRRVDGDGTEKLGRRHPLLDGDFKVFPIASRDDGDAKPIAHHDDALDHANACVGRAADQIDQGVGHPHRRVRAFVDGEQGRASLAGDFGVGEAWVDRPRPAKFIKPNASAVVADEEHLAPAPRARRRAAHICRVDPV